MPQIEKRPFMAAVMRAKRLSVKSFGAARSKAPPQSCRDNAPDRQNRTEFQPG
jgi:hypothetical protein